MDHRPQIGRGPLPDQREDVGGELGLGRPDLMAKVPADVKCLPMGLGLATQGRPWKSGS